MLSPTEIRQHAAVERARLPERVRPLQVDPPVAIAQSLYDLADAVDERRTSPPRLR